MYCESQQLFSSIFVVVGWVSFAVVEQSVVFASAGASQFAVMWY